MFEAGIIIFFVGCILSVWLRLNAHSEVRALTPRRIGERVSAIRLMKQKRRIDARAANIMLIVGAILILIYGVFN